MVVGREWCKLVYNYLCVNLMIFTKGVLSFRYRLLIIDKKHEG